MKLNCSYSLVVCGGLLFSASLLHAQVSDPGNSNAPVQNAPNSPMQQGATHSQQPGFEPDSTGGTTNPQAMKDKIFLRKAFENGVAEVEMGKLALSKSSNEDVKKFAQEMLDDHTTFDGAIRPYADSQGVRAAKKMNKADQEEYEKLKGLSGEAFDKEYLLAMVKGHWVDLHEFRAEAANAADPELKDAATTGAKVIHDHLVAVYKLAVANGVEIPKPPKPTTPSS
jgi:putative membrane protein